MEVWLALAFGATPQKMPEEQNLPNMAYGEAYGCLQLKVHCATRRRAQGLYCEVEGHSLLGGRAVRKVTVSQSLVTVLSRGEIDVFLDRSALTAAH